MMQRCLVVVFALVAVCLLAPQAVEAEDCKCDQGQQCGEDAQGNSWACSGAFNARVCDIPVGAAVGTCVQCIGNADCSFDPMLGWCSDNVCHHCVINAHCSNMGEGAVCLNQTTCVACDESVGCAPSEVCANPGSGSAACVECVTDDDCTNNNNAFCSNNNCGGCSTDSQCMMKFGPEAPMCNGGLCVECKDDMDCNDPAMECNNGSCQIMPGCT